MLLSTIIAIVPMLVTAAPSPTSTCSEDLSSTTSTPPAKTSVAVPYGVMALRSASPIHFLTMNARNLSFYLGGVTTTYCPVEENIVCPAGNETVFVQPNVLSEEVPGGQVIYAATDGHIGFSQAHARGFFPGAVYAPFTFTPVTDEAFSGLVSTSAFGATGLMACPTLDSQWQVYAAIQNATVPTGDISDCLGFDAVTENYTGPTPAAWQYV